MRMRSKTCRFIGCLAVLLTLLAGTAQACVDYRPRPAGLLKDVLSDDPAGAKAAVEKLRAMGPEGLGVLMDVYERVIRENVGRRQVAYPAYGRATFQAACTDDSAVGAPQKRNGQTLLTRPAPPDGAALWKRLSGAIDAVAAQKDAAHAGLYWHTDLDKARAAARESGKPILSLRLLGTLDTEFSCANSRFFRTVLYANAEVSAALRDRFVLHWQSVRPVPKVTIDMGDGRVIERTITGNSIHYVLDAEGRPVDAIPGLYGPKAFLRALADAEEIAGATRTVTESDVRAAMLKDWHGARAARLTEQWEHDLASLGATRAAANSAAEPAALIPLKGLPTAVDAAPLAIGKSAVELNLVRALAPRVAALRASTSDEAWAKIAALPAHAADGRLDAGSIALVRSKQATAIDAGERSRAKRMVEDPLVRVVANLQRSVAEDTVRNEYGFHRTIHEWFANQLPETIAADAGPLNEKVYAELFLTPSNDPWLGLVPADAYSALEGDGVRKDVN